MTTKDHPTRLERPSRSHPSRPVAPLSGGSSSFAATAREQLSKTITIPRAVGSPHEIVDAAVLNFIGGVTSFGREAPLRSCAPGWLLGVTESMNLLRNLLNHSLKDYLLTLTITRGGRSNSIDEGTAATAAPQQ
jgi:hypothetical protein